MGFNLANPEQLFDSEAEVWIKVEHPSQIDVFFEVKTRSKRHPENKEKLRKLSRKFSKDKQEAERKRQDVDATKYQDDLLALTSALIVDWRGVYDGEKEDPFDTAKISKLMDSQPWIFEQIDSAQADDTNFFTAGQ